MNLTNIEYGREQQITEQVEIVEGLGSTEYFIYDIDMSSITYSDTVLGSITFGEDGSLVTETEGQSLVTLTYTTKYDYWRADSPEIGKVQFYVEEP